MRLRRATQDDCRLLWQWTNDPATRAASFSSAYIPWSEHVEWFEKITADSNLILLIGESEERVSIGQIRFQVNTQEAVVSVNIAPQFRGRGLGRAMIVAGSEQLFRESKVQLIHAYIKPESAASVLAFAAAGYQDAGAAEVRGQMALHRVLKRYSE